MTLLSHLFHTADWLSPVHPVNSYCPSPLWRPILDLEGKGSIVLSAGVSGWAGLILTHVRTQRP